MNHNERRIDAVSFASIIIIMFIITYVLYIGSSLIIPFIIAVLLAFAVIGLYGFFNIRLKLPKSLSIVFSIFTYIFVFWFIGALIQANVNQLIDLAPSYQERFSSLIIQVSSNLGLPNDLGLLNFIKGLNLQKLITSIIGGLTSIISDIGLIFFYLIFILFEYRFFRKKINIILKDFSNKKEVIKIIEQIKADTKRYFVVKTGISFLSSLVSYIIMLSCGLDFAAFWAVLIFILNFIPSVGSIIGFTFPVILSFIQPDMSISAAVAMTSSLLIFDQITGNIIEPKLLGQSLNLSPVVIILALGFWGMIWGIVGMFLSAPIMVITNIILSRIPTTKPIAILLSEKGDIAK